MASIEQLIHDIEKCDYHCVAGRLEMNVSWQELKNLVISKQSENWKISQVEKYYYASGRNYWTFVETTYWYDSTTRERKEITRSETISTGCEYSLPDWAKSISTRNRKLESDF